MKYGLHKNGAVYKKRGAGGVLNVEMLTK